MQQEPDLQTSRLEIISALTRTVDQISVGLASTTYADLLDRFGKKSLTNEETTALTTVGLRTDLSSLLVENKDKTSNIEDIKELLTNEEKQIRDSYVSRILK